jgi:hypothetical protein
LAVRIDTPDRPLEAHRDALRGRDGGVVAANERGVPRREKPRQVLTPLPSHAPSGYSGERAMMRRWSGAPAQAMKISARAWKSMNLSPCRQGRGTLPGNGEPPAVIARNRQK